MTEPGSTRFRLGIAYDGTHFRGWAPQPGLRTVQGVLDDALATLLRKHGPVASLVVAGRTDAGVHATGQVAHVDLSDGQVAALARSRVRRSEQGPGALLAGRLTGILGSATDVVVRHGEMAAEGFDARFSALWRRYRYRIADGAAERDPLQRHRTLWHPRTLDDDAMGAAARGMLGLRDFAAYCRPRPESTTIRTLQDFSWSRDADGVLVAEVRADAFCHSMVRSLVGACVAVGEGRLPVERPGQLLATAGRANEFAVLPAKGLTLLEVGYPPAAELAARAEQTRARRAALDSGAPGAEDDEDD